MPKLKKSALQPLRRLAILSILFDLACTTTVVEPPELVFCGVDSEHLEFDCYDPRDKSYVVKKMNEVNNYGCYSPEDLKSLFLYIKLGCSK